MEEIGILQNFTGIMIHDHWSAYFTYGGWLHAVCNAHHLHELQAVIELSPEYAWAKKTKELLLTIKDTVELAGGVLSFEEQERFKKSYRDLMALGLSENVIPELLRTPEEIGIDGKKKHKKRLKKSRERNLVERLARHEEDVLRFMTDKDVPFTNNQGKRDLRMAKDIGMF
jgi:transposase